MGDDRIDQAAAVLTSTLHQGDGGRQARDLLAFDANTMGKADYTAMVQQVQTGEALNINDLMRQGRHDEALNLLREDANIFLGSEQFMGLAGEIKAMNKATHAPTHLDFDPVYQNGDQYGRPTALEVNMSTTFQNPSTGQRWERRDLVARTDNHLPQDECHVAPPREVVVIQPPPPPPVIIDDRNRGGFTFNLEIEIGRERVRRHDPRWCPDREWRPMNAPPNFNLEIEIGRVRDDYRRRGDNNWNPSRPTSQTIINQINNTTIINNNQRYDSHNTTDNSRTRNVDSHDQVDRSRARNTERPVFMPPQRHEAPNGGQQGQDRQGQDRQGHDRQGQDRQGQDRTRQNPTAQDRRDAAEQRRDAAEQRRDASQQQRRDGGQDQNPHNRRPDRDRDEKEKKKN